MIEVSVFKGRKVALFGLGGSGLATAKALKAGGAEIIVWDDREEAAEKAKAEGLRAQNLRKADWRGISALILSPGVPLTHPKPHWSVDLAHKAGAEIIGDIELFLRARAAFLAARGGQSADCPLIAITGTNGKSTATALTAHILAQAGFDAQMGGNIGKPALELEAFGAGAAERGLAPSETRRNDKIAAEARAETRRETDLKQPLSEERSSERDKAQIIKPLSAARPGETKEAPRQVYVLELSSYQIDLAPSLQPLSEARQGAGENLPISEAEQEARLRAPNIGILLNITPDHIDRHGTFANYAAVKERLAAAAETAIIGVDDEHCRDIYDRLAKAGKKPIPLLIDNRSFIETANMSGLTEFDFYFSFGGKIYRRKGSEFPTDTPGADLNNIPALRGRHNMQDALAAVNSCALLGVAETVIAAALPSFKGLPHRMEEVGRRRVQGGEIIFINDSKATNAEAAEPALAAFRGINQNIYWIAGGRQKKGGIAGLRGLNEIQKAYLIGEAAAEFAAAIGAQLPADRVMMSGALAAAVRRAAQDAENDLHLAALQGEKPQEAIILLAPACASFDQFKNFEERGAAFTKLAQDYCAARGAGR